MNVKLYTLFSRNKMTLNRVRTSAEVTAGSRGPVFAEPNPPLGNAVVIGDSARSQSEWKVARCLHDP